MFQDIIIQSSVQCLLARLWLQLVQSQLMLMTPLYKWFFALNVEHEGEITFRSVRCVMQEHVRTCRPQTLWLQILVFNSTIATFVIGRYEISLHLHFHNYNYLHFRYSAKNLLPSKASRILATRSSNDSSYASIASVSPRVLSSSSCNFLCS